MKVTSKICMTKDVGLNSYLFGGNMMAWADEAAAIFARQVTKEDNLVTMKFGEFLFKKPVKVGDIVEFLCDNPHIGNTSVSFQVYAYVKDVVVLETSCVFVAIGEDGHSKVIDKSKL